MDQIMQETDKRLFQAILTLNTPEECQAFFQDACTIKEIHEIAQRFEVASLLWEGKNYGVINEITGASTATICRVKKALFYGRDGYKTALSRMEEAE